MQGTERDLLIELKTKVEALIKSVDAFTNKMDQKDIVVEKISERLITVEGKTEENEKFRYWVIGSIITSLASAVVALFRIKI